MRETPVTYAVQTEKASPKFARAFALGCGGLASPSETLLPGPVALFGSPARFELLQQAIDDGRDWYYGDHGLFRRFQYFRVTRNGYQHPGTGTASPDRFKKLNVDLQPSWQTDGTAIIICPNSPVYMERFQLDAHDWVSDIVTVLAKLTDRPIVVRWKSQAAKRPLYVDLHDAYLLITFSSAAAVEALAAGVPVCTLAPWASTARMGLQELTQIEHPYYPTIDERDQFLFNLAAQQWTLDEIERGVAWKALSRD